MRFYALILLALFGTVPLSAQDVARHNLEIGAAGVFPVGDGYLSNRYSPGAGGRGDYELRLIRPLGAEVGFTGAGMPGLSCTRFGCEHPREAMKFLDFGLRGHLVLGRVDLSVGVGGGYLWYESGDSFTNSTLFQYSGKAAMALDRGGRLRLALSVRTWRDLGRPIQQWVAASGGLIFGLGHVSH